MTLKNCSGLGILFIILLPALVSAQGRWIEVGLPTNNSSLFRISFADSLHGCLAGGDGTFLYTEDGGSTWNARTIPAAYQVRECKLVTDDVAWAFTSINEYSGFERSVLRSTDKGITWERLNPPDTLPIYSVQFVSSTLAYAVSQVSFWACTDGAAWEQRGDISPTLHHMGLEFFDQDNGYKGGGCGLVVGGKSEQTTDGGWTWRVTCSFFPPYVEIDTHVPDHFVNGRIGTIHSSSGGEFGNEAGIGLTWNSGRTYTSFNNMIQNSYRFGFALDSLNMWLLRDQGQVRRTTNGGVTWNEDTLAVPISEMLCDIFGHRFALGAGRLFRFDPNATAVEDNEAQPWDFALHQNYPNPFNPTTRIVYGVNSREFIELRVFDVLGREVATLVNEQLQPGSYETTFDASGLASGVYLYRLQGADFVSVRKMLVVK